MFLKLQYKRRDTLNHCDTLYVIDNCEYLNEVIHTCFGSPKLDYKINGPGIFGNSLVTLAVIRHYELKTLNVAKNIAEYYKWLTKLGFLVDDKFITTQLSMLEDNKFLNTKPKTKYLNLINHYMIAKPKQELKSRFSSLRDADFLMHTLYNSNIREY